MHCIVSEWVVRAYLSPLRHSTAGRWRVGASRRSVGGGWRRRSSAGSGRRRVAASGRVGTARATLLDVVVLGAGVVEVVVGGVETAHGAVGSTDERVGTLLIGRDLPEHASTETLLLEVVNLGLDHVGGVEGDESLGSSIVSVAALSSGVALDLSTWLRKSLVVPDAVLPATLADAAVRLTETLSVGESTAVDGHTENDLVGGDSSVDVGADGDIGVEGSGVLVLGVGVEVGVVTGSIAPRTGVVVGHQVDVVEDLAEIFHVKRAEVFGTGGGGHGELEVVAARALTKGIQLSADGLEEEDHVGGLSVVLGVLPIDVDTVESPISNKLDSRLGESLACGIGSSSRGEVGGPGPTTDGKHNLQVAVSLLQLEKLVDTSIDVVAGVAPSCGS